jgi:hypothetical protein
LIDTINIDNIYRPVSSSKSARSIDLPERQLDEEGDMSRTLEAAREIQQDTQVSLVLRTRALLLRSANAIAMVFNGVREGVTACRKYEQLRAKGSAHEDAIERVRVDTSRIGLAGKLTLK